MVMVMMVRISDGRWRGRINTAPQTGGTGGDREGRWRRLLVDIMVVLLLLEQLLDLSDVDELLEFALVIGFGLVVPKPIVRRLEPADERVGLLEVVKTGERIRRVVVSATSARVFASHRERQHLFNLRPCQPVAVGWPSGNRGLVFMRLASVLVAVLDNDSPGISCPSFLFSPTRICTPLKNNDFTLTNFNT